MRTVIFNFGENSSYYENDYGYKLVCFMEENNFSNLPKYKFNKSLNEMILEDDEIIRGEVNEYAYYCLTHLEEVIKLNK